MGPQLVLVAVAVLSLAGGVARHRRERGSNRRRPMAAVLLASLFVVVAGAATSAAPAKQLPSPKDVAAAADSTTSIVVSFATVPGASSYNVFLYGASGKDSATYTNAQSSGTRIEALTTCTTYRVAVQAVSTSTTTRTSVLSGRIAVTTQCNPALVPTFATPTSTSDGFSVQVANYDADFSWSASMSAGAATIDSSGLVTVTGLTTDTAATLTVTTSRTGYDSGSNTVSAARNSAPSRWIGSGDFTVEFWVQPTAEWGGRQELFVLTRPDATARLDVWYHGTWTVYGDGGPSTWAFWRDAGSIAAPAVGSWTHVALTRNNGVMRLYVAGAKVIEFGSAADLTTLNQVQLGADPNDGCLCNRATALLSNIRVVDGTALYTGDSLTVPTSALSGIAGTTFLLNNALGQPTAGSVVLDGNTLFEQTIDSSSGSPVLSEFAAYRLDGYAWTPTTVTTSTASPFVR